MKTKIIVSKRIRHLAHVYLIMSLFVLMSQVSSAQLITSGTVMKVIPGTTVILNNTLTIQGTGSFSNDGTVYLKSHLVNLNTGNNSLGNGSLKVTGTTLQTISGQNVIQNILVANPAGLLLTGNTTVNGTLSLVEGITTLGNSNLLLGSTASVSGNFSSGNMIVPTGTGQVQKMFSATGNITFPVGDETGSAEYSPVTLSINSGSFDINSYVGLNLTNAPYPGTSNSYITRYWNVTSSGITNFSCNATFQYTVADVVGSESDLFSFKVDPLLPWTAYNETNTATHELTIHGLSSFGSFTGNKGNGSVPPAIRSLQDKNIIEGTECADALQTLIIAGNGTSYTVQTSGHVTHIAGQKIVYYPGTKVFPGGYLHGYISTTFCNPYQHPGAAPVVAGSGESNDPSGTETGFCRIYPNPTPGNLTMELDTKSAITKVHMDITGILGEKIYSADLPGDPKQEFSLAGRPSGMYVIHVSSGENTYTQKIIKQ